MIPTWLKYCMVLTINIQFGITGHTGFYSPLEGMLQRSHNDQLKIHFLWELEAPQIFHVIFVSLNGQYLTCFTA